MNFHGTDLSIASLSHGNKEGSFKKRDKKLFGI